MYFWRSSHLFANMGRISVHLVLSLFHIVCARASAFSYPVLTFVRDSVIFSLPMTPHTFTITAVPSFRFSTRISVNLSDPFLSFFIRRSILRLIKFSTLNRCLHFQL